MAQHGEEPKYRTINTRNEKFCNRVWRHEAARTILLTAGWEETPDGFLVFPADLDASVMGQLAAAIERLVGPAAGAVSRAAAPGASASTSASDCPPQTQAEIEKGERDARIRADRTKAAEAAAEDRRKRDALKAQIDADRRANASRQSQASVARNVQFGSGSKVTFGDIGVNLNKGG